MLHFLGKTTWFQLPNHCKTSAQIETIVGLDPLEQICGRNTTCDVTHSITNTGLHVAAARCLKQSTLAVEESGSENYEQRHVDMMTITKKHVEILTKSWTVSYASEG